MALIRTGGGTKSKAYIAKLGNPNVLTELTSGVNTIDNVLGSCYIACGDNFSSLAVTVSGGSYNTGFIFKKDGTSQQITANTFTLNNDANGALFKIDVSNYLTFAINATV